MSTQDMELYCQGAKCDFEQHFGILQSSAIQLLFLNRFMLHLLHNTSDSVYDFVHIPVWSFQRRTLENSWAGCQCFLSEMEPMGLDIRYYSKMIFIMGVICFTDQEFPLFRRYRGPCLGLKSQASGNTPWSGQAALLQAWKRVWSSTGAALGITSAWRDWPRCWGAIQ